MQLPQITQSFIDKAYLNGANGLIHGVDVNYRYAAQELDGEVEYDNTLQKLTILLRTDNVRTGSMLKQRGFVEKEGNFCQELNCRIQLASELQEQFSGKLQTVDMSPLTLTANEQEIGNKEWLQIHIKLTLSFLSTNLTPDEFRIEMNKQIDEHLKEHCTRIIDSENSWHDTNQYGVIVVEAGQTQIHMNLNVTKEGLAKFICLFHQCDINISQESHLSMKPADFQLLELRNDELQFARGLFLEVLQVGGKETKVRLDYAIDSTGRLTTGISSAFHVHTGKQLFDHLRIRDLLGGEKQKNTFELSYKNRIGDHFQWCFDEKDPYINDE